MPRTVNGTGHERLGAERAVQAVGVLDAPIIFIPAAVAERGRGDGDDRKERRVFAHVRYFEVHVAASRPAYGGGGVAPYDIFDFRGPRRRRRRVVAMGGVPKHWLFVCLSYEPERVARCPPSSSVASELI